MAAKVHNIYIYIYEVLLEDINIKTMSYYINTKI